MQRISTRYATESGLFTEGNPNTGSQATEFSAAWCNALQEEVVNAVLGSDQVLSANDNTQLLKAIRLGGREIQTDWVAGGQFGADESSTNWDKTDQGGFSTKATNATPIARWCAPYSAGTLITSVTVHYRVAAQQGGMEIKATIVNLATNGLSVIDTWTLDASQSNLGYATVERALGYELGANERLVLRALLNAGSTQPAPVELLGVDVAKTMPTA